MIAPIRTPPRRTHRRPRNIGKARAWVAKTLFSGAAPKVEPSSSHSRSFATWSAAVWMSFIAAAYLAHMLFPEYFR
ncbi:MAG: hypothetical protein JNK76_04200 [Planctomycetales bacterium]|nr:hypothetical protein [Planctomycetales bacterium]MBN8627735.1 hypothetical protein [Planctomycetota bacterium]